MAPTHVQDTRHIELDLGGSSLTYEPGGLLGTLSWARGGWAGPDVRAGWVARHIELGQGGLGWA